MKITYTGTQEELPARQRAKFEVKLQKLSKMLERKGEKEAHIIVTKERFLNCVEITVNAFDHALVGAGSDGDLATALNEAVERIEQQIIRLRSKWRDTRRSKDKENLMLAAQARPSGTRAETNATSRPGAKAKIRKTTPQVFPVNDHAGRKPMTLDEAMLEMDASQSYLVFRDARTDRLTVLMRRKDGNFDLIES